MIIKSGSCLIYNVLDYLTEHLNSKTELPTPEKNISTISKCIVTRNDTLFLVHRPCRPSYFFMPFSLRVLDNFCLLLPTINHRKADGPVEGRWSEKKNLI